ncbi:MAG: hypothetical protein HYV63_01420 [Candidatus Schekmanbacteria bacterium]|nr:hypothetical protein [Candidatus Schekmanbacteria bacterium]
MTGRVFVCPVINALGPARDPRHPDLLATWPDVDRGLARYFERSFRDELRDSVGRPVQLSWFPVSWSGFSSNPVNRDFGWFTVYDHLVETWGEAMARAGDGIYWMYNHPDRSGVGNVWGLDWFHNCHYLNVLNRLLLERAYFPGAVQIPTANSDSTNFTEAFFPFELSNRNAKHINWNRIEADGRRLSEVLQWASAPDDWQPYRPSHEDHQRPGRMNHWMFRIVDLRTDDIAIPGREWERAFAQAAAGADVVVAAYEHDFRDRAHVVQEVMLKPIAQAAQRFPEVRIVNATFQEAALAITGGDARRPGFSLERRQGYDLIRADTPLFGVSPYVAIRDDATGVIRQDFPVPCGKQAWALPADALPERGLAGIAGFAAGGRQGVARFLIESGSEPVTAPCPAQVIPL